MTMDRTSVLTGNILTPEEQRENALIDRLILILTKRGIVGAGLDIMAEQKHTGLTYVSTLPPKKRKWGSADIEAAQAPNLTDAEKEADRCARAAGFNPKTPEQVFYTDLTNELTAARKKFPYNNLSMTALTEEVGELAKALLDETGDRVWREAIQVAAMAMRVAIEGDSSFHVHRQNKGLGCPTKGYKVECHKAIWGTS